MIVFFNKILKITGVFYLSIPNVFFGFEVKNLFLNHTNVIKVEATIWIGDRLYLGLWIFQSRGSKVKTDLFLHRHSSRPEE